MNRRDFLRASALGAVGVLAAACAPQVIEKTVEVEVETVEVATVEVATMAPINISIQEIWRPCWGESQIAIYDRAEEAFRAEHPDRDITFEWLEIPCDDTMDDATYASAQAGAYADLSYCQPYHLPSFADSVPLAPLDEARKEVGGDEAFSFGSKWKGKEYMNFLYGGPEIAWVNSTWLGEAGVEFPKSWDEYIPIGETVSDPSNGKYATCLILAGAQTSHLVWGYFFPWLLQAGGQLIDDQNRLIINEGDAGAQVLEFWREMEDAEILVPGSLTNAGSAALQFMGAETMAWLGYEGPWQYSNILSAEPPFEVDGAVVPEGPGGRQALANGTGISVNANAEALEHAIGFMMLLTTGEPAYEISIDKVMFTPFKPIAERLAKELPKMQPEIEQGELGAQGLPAIAAWADLPAILSLRIGEFWEGQKSAQQALDDAVDDWQAATERV